MDALFPNTFSILVYDKGENKGSTVNHDFPPPLTQFLWGGEGGVTTLLAVFSGNNIPYSHILFS